VIPISGYHCLYFDTFRELSVSVGAAGLPNASRKCKARDDLAMYKESTCDEICSDLIY
jgi:hypothetical protein